MLATRAGSGVYFISEKLFFFGLFSFSPAGRRDRYSLPPTELPQLLVQEANWFAAEAAQVQILQRQLSAQVLSCRLAVVAVRINKGAVQLMLPIRQVRSGILCRPRDALRKPLFPFEPSED